MSSLILDLFVVVRDGVRRSTLAPKRAYWLDVPKPYVGPFVPEGASFPSYTPPLYV